VRLEGDAGRLPLVVEFSSVTCPVRRAQARPMQDLARKYQGRAEFLFVYSREAHRPAGAEGEFLQAGVPARQAATPAERRQGAALLRAEVEPARRLLLDGFGADSLFEHCFGGSGADNPLLVVGADGRVALVLWWADPAEVEPVLDSLLGG
jgi:Iodothyronine deiodinase